MLLTVINGDPDARYDVDVPQSITRPLRETHGEAVVEEFRKVVELRENRAAATAVLPP